MPVHRIVTAASAAARMPQNPINPSVRPKKNQPMPKIAAGTKVSTENTPSRDSHELRHCEKARHARSGRPRCQVDDSSPATARASATASETKAKPGFRGTNPNGAAIPVSSRSPNPAPDAVLKKTIEKAGFIPCVSSRQQPVDPAPH